MRLRTQWKETLNQSRHILEVPIVPKMDNPIINEAKDGNTSQKPITSPYFLV